MRILMIAACPFPARRGTPVRIEKLAQGLCALGHEVRVLAYPIGEHDRPFAFGLQRLGGRFEQGTLAPGPTARKLFYLDPGLAREARAALLAGGFDIVHAHHVEGLAIGAWACRDLDTPLVFDAHTLLESELPFYRTGMSRAIAARAGRLLDGLLPRLADHTITCTHDIREKMIARSTLDPADLTTAMNGVELDHFAPIVRSWPASMRRLVYTGTLAPYQGIDLMLEAFAIALREIRDLELVIATGSSFAPYEGRAKALRIREAITLVEDDFRHLFDRLSASAIALLPRECCDGIPQKLLNYMAAGRAVIASQGSAKIGRNGHSILSVANGDSHAFAKAILDLVRNPSQAREIGLQARRLVAREHGWEKPAMICEAVFTSLLARREAPAGAGVRQVEGAAE